ncbi:PREDICTED: vesicle transport protein USE1-like [Amphimedon queenslandica]|uniref:Vesicle transport protein USE1 n=1 Tax=Amphimedon queenslandica TaxID=400682 RepID=A0A1X7TDC3_AMPQE|nr:PREDICTED: vesicle transport protein USE1-like [Amphimedon queenslandica]|eukprot:XP_011407764.1 PREDICTED: vesicle transport protein USE1-like [Amphimedon queenslandica]
MAAGRVMKDVERLISRCEEILGDKLKIRGQEWRIVKYVETLTSRINELENTSSLSQVCLDQLISFKGRLTILQEVANEIKDKLERKKNEETSSTPHDSCLTSSSTTDVPNQRILNDTTMRGSGLLRRSATKSSQAMREELFSRQESLKSSSTSKTLNEREMMQAMADHEKQQERIAQDMIELSRSLKQQSLAARDIIKSDTQVLKKTSISAEDNISGMTQETDRLKEKSKGCSCWVWMMLIIVFIVFIQMIMFIRLYPKRR